MVAGAGGGAEECGAGAITGGCETDGPRTVGIIEEEITDGPTGVAVVYNARPLSAAAAMNSRLVCSRSSKATAAPWRPVALCSRAAAMRAWFSARARSTAAHSAAGGAGGGAGGGGGVVVVDVVVVVVVVAVVAVVVEVTLVAVVVVDDVGGV